MKNNFSYSNYNDTHIASYLSSNRHLHCIDQPQSHRSNKNVPSHWTIASLSLTEEALNHHRSATEEESHVKSWTAHRRQEEKLPCRGEGFLHGADAKIWKVDGFDHYFGWIVIICIELWFSCAWNFKQWSVCQIALKKLLTHT